MTAQSDVEQLIRVAVKHPRDAFGSQAAVDAQWKDLNFSAPPDFSRACDEFDRFVAVLEEHGTAVEFLPADPRAGLDSIYARDASIATDHGVIICNMGKAMRSGEPAAQLDAFSQGRLPVRGRISAPGTVEGGDVTWLDRQTIAVGHGYRTNAEGIDQLRRLLIDSIDRFVVVPLPHWHGVTDVMHLMSLISPVGPRTAVVYSRLLPVPFRSQLLDLGFGLIDVPDEEFESMGTNVLTVSPGVVVTVKGNPQTRRRLEASGLHVIEYEGTEISVKGAGGPTCLTRPLLRSA